MRLKMSITGTVTQVDPCVSGDDDDPIRLVAVDLGDVSWKMISLNLDDETMEIEITPAESIAYDTGEVDEENKPIWAVRPTTPDEKLRLIEHVRSLSLEKMSKKALYDLSKSPRLKNPFKA